MISLLFLKRTHVTGNQISRLANMMLARATNMKRAYRRINLAVKHMYVLKIDKLELAVKSQHTPCRCPYRIRS